MYKDLDPAEAAVQRHQKRDIDAMWDDGIGNSTKKEEKPAKKKGSLFPWGKKRETEKPDQMKMEESEVKVDLTPPVDETPTDKKEEVEVTPPPPPKKDNSPKKSPGTRILAITLVGLLIFFTVSIGYLLFVWDGGEPEPVNPDNPPIEDPDQPEDPRPPVDYDDLDSDSPTLNYVFPYELYDRDVEIKLEYDENKRIKADTIGRVYKMNFDGATLRIYVNTPHFGRVENMIGGTVGEVVEDQIYRVKAKDVEALGSNHVWGYHTYVGESETDCSTLPTPCYEDSIFNHSRYGSVEITLTYPKSLDDKIGQEIVEVSDELVKSIMIEESVSAKYMGTAEKNYPSFNDAIYFEKCYELEDICEHFLLSTNQAELISGKLDETQKGGIFSLTGFLNSVEQVERKLFLLQFEDQVIVDQEELVSHDDGDSNKFFDATYKGEASDIAYEYSGYVYFEKCDVKTSSCNDYLLDKSISAKYTYFLGNDYFEKEFLIAADLEGLGAAGGKSYYKLVGDIDIKLLD